MTAATFKQLEELGREKLSPSFYMREFLYSEIAYSKSLVNFPDDPDLALAAGKKLCEQVLEPIQQALGRISIRSGYRSPAVNDTGNRHKMNCANNAANRAAHIWDQRDEDGYMGATACVVVTSFVPYYEKTGDWPALAWWIWEKIPDCASQCWFPNLAAVNLRWSENPGSERFIKSYVAHPKTGKKDALVKNGVSSIAPPYEPHFRSYLNTLARNP